MFGQKTQNGKTGGPPNGLAMLMRSFGIDPAEIMENFNQLITRGNTYAESFDARLKALEDLARRNDARLAENSAKLDRLLEVSAVNTALQEVAKEVTLVEVTHVPQLENDIWPASIVQPK